MRELILRENSYRTFLTAHLFSCEKLLRDLLTKDLASFGKLSCPRTLLLIHVCRRAVQRSGEHAWRVNHVSTNNHLLHIVSDHRLLELGQGLKKLP